MWMNKLTCTWKLAKVEYFCTGGKVARNRMDPTFWLEPKRPIAGAT